MKTGASEIDKSKDRKRRLVEPKGCENKEKEKKKRKDKTQTGSEKENRVGRTNGEIQRDINGTIE